MYWEDKWEFPDSNEYEYKYAGKYGGKGQKRAKRKKPTPEQIRRQNQANKETRMRRLIKANFVKYDLWVTLKYPEGTRKTLKELKKDFQAFRARLRKAYKKLGVPLKYIYRLEVGERGGLHAHILLNRIWGEDTDTLIQEAWTYGRANYESVYEYGGYKKLANYIVKQSGDDEVQGQLCLFEEAERKELLKYSCSRNLVRPRPDRKKYRRWTVKKLIKDGPEPTPGYYIDKESVRCGVNKFTGMSYLHYTECRIKGGG